MPQGQQSSAQPSLSLMPPQLLQQSGRPQQPPSGAQQVPSQQQLLQMTGLPSQPSEPLVENKEPDLSDINGVLPEVEALARIRMVCRQILGS